LSILAAITISAAQFEQAGKAVAQMNRAVGDRDDDDEVVSFRGLGSSSASSRRQAD
jgi:hypothetical protein